MTDDERVAEAEARPISGHELLERLAALPVATWRYHWEPPEVRHLGPMSQDFRAAFGLGSDERRIDMVDANGVLTVAPPGTRSAVRSLGGRGCDTARLLASFIVHPGGF